MLKNLKSYLTTITNIQNICFLHAQMTLMEILRKSLTGSMKRKIVRPHRYGV